MMRRYYRARISLAEMKKAIASVASTVLAEIEVETSHASEVQGIEKSISI